VGAVIVSKRRSTSIASAGPGGTDKSDSSAGPAPAGEEGKTSAGTAAA